MPGLVSVVSYLVAGHRSLYPSQIMIRPKARTFVRRKNADGKSSIKIRFEGVPYEKIVRFYIEKIKNKIIERR